MSRPPLPPFTEDSAKKKIRLAEGGWNSRDPVKVALVFTPGSRGLTITRVFPSLACDP